MKLAVLDEIEVDVVEDDKYGFLLSTEDVSNGYGVKPSSIRSHKSTNKDDFVQGKHFVVEKNSRNREKIMWTQKGIVRLGFFVKSKEAREFRDWAEDYIVHGKPMRIDGKDPRFIIGGLQTVNTNLRKKNQLLEEMNDKLIAENTTLALPAPAVDVEPYKERIEFIQNELNEEKNLKEHFGTMALNMANKVNALKHVPKLIKKEMGNYLDHPELYAMLGALATGLENDIKGRV